MNTLQITTWTWSAWSLQLSEISNIVIIIIIIIIIKDIYIAPFRHAPKALYAVKILYAPWSIKKVPLFWTDFIGRHGGPNSPEIPEIAKNCPEIWSCLKISVI